MIDTESFFNRIQRAFGNYEEQRDNVKEALKTLKEQPKVAQSGVRALREIADVFEELHDEQVRILERLQISVGDDTLRNELAHIATTFSMLEHILRETNVETVAKAIHMLDEAAQEKLSRALGETS